MDFDFIVAIGDIHGCIDELKQLVELCDKHMGDAKFKYLFLGDYVDRGPDSEGCVLFIKNMVERDRAIALMGNHEHMACVAWAYGGPMYDKRVASMPADLFRWLSKLPLYYQTKRHIFVHAGLRPDQIEQDPSDLLWIREPFLSHKGKFAKYVVHGHSPTNYYGEAMIYPDIRDNRCNLDTGCVFNGQLSAGIFDLTQEKPIHTISVPRSQPINYALMNPIYPDKIDE